MRKVLILLLTLCAFTAAMVPREKRAVNTEEKHSALATTKASSTKHANSTEICQPNTPCAWTIDKPYTFISNSYCICGPGTDCVFDEDDKMVNAYVHRCRAPGSTSNSETGTR